MTRTEILELANEYVTKDRAATHGEAEDSFETIAKLWSEFLEHQITSQDVCAMMLLLKIARIKENPNHVDSWVDVAGYASIGGSLAR